MSEITQSERIAPAAPRDSKGFGAGFAAPWHGWRYLLHHRSLWPYAILPMIVTLVATLVLLGLLFVAGYYFMPQLGGGWWKTTLEVLIGIAIFTVALALGIVAYFLINGIVGDYFRGLLTEKVEIQLGMAREDIVELPIMYHVVDALRDLTFLVFINIAFLMCHIVPVIGSIAGMCGSFYYEIFTFGVDYLDYPLALRGMRRKEKWTYAKSYRRLTLGLGTVTFVFSFIPILGSIVLTSASVGAVLLYRRIEGLPTQPPSST